jgi:N-glycosylase/DNA lyase
VWQIACRDFDRSLIESKSLTPAVYKRVGELFRDRYGPHAGWAHSLLFAAELAIYQPNLPGDLREEMQRFADQEKKRKFDIKAAKKASKEQAVAELEGSGKVRIKEEIGSGRSNIGSKRKSTDKRDIKEEPQAGARTGTKTSKRARKVS